MAMLKASWEGHSNVFESSSTLAEFLRKLRREEHPMLIELCHDRGPTLFIGVGPGDSVLTYFANDQARSSWTSVGDYDKRGDSLVFMRDGEPQEFEPALGVGFETALKAASDFLETGAQPMNLNWANDWN
jgi:hypothetical protein